MTQATYRHCGARIVRVQFTLGARWVHQPSGAAFNDGQYEHCRVTIAEPRDDEVARP